jgi:hypothetical protein
MENSAPSLTPEGQRAVKGCHDIEDLAIISRSMAEVAHRAASQPDLSQAPEQSPTVAAAYHWATLQH